MQNEILTYNSPFTIYGLSWSQRPNTFRLGLSSFQQDYNNKLSVIQLQGDAFVQIAETDHLFPVTKLGWSPYKGGRVPDLFGTTGDYLRVWELVNPDENNTNATSTTNSNNNNTIGTNNTMNTNGCELVKRATLASVRKAGQAKRDYCAPLTSFDWNETDPRFLVTSSIDTTCTVWDLQQQVAKTQLIAHDSEVYDVAFAKGTNIFASVGADGSVRMFDLRSLEHSTILYETPAKTPSLPSSSSESPSLLRLAWNRQDSNYIATFQVDSSSVIILDVRVPAIPVAELHGHSGPINAIGWAPHSSGHVCTVADDGQALIWDVSQMSKNKNIQEPILAYTAESEVNQFSWCASHPEWVAIAFGNTIQALRV